MKPPGYRLYEPSECITFRKTDEPFGALSNMAGGYPLLVNGIGWPSTEAVYQACRYPHLPDVQEEIRRQASAMTAKMKSKKFRPETRPDWDEMKVRIMRWCLRLKLAQHSTTFGVLLLSTGDAQIVESSRRDDYWGAVPTEDGKLYG